MGAVSLISHAQYYSDQRTDERNRVWLYKTDVRGTIPAMSRREQKRLLKRAREREAKEGLHGRRSRASEKGFWLTVVEENLGWLESAISIIYTSPISVKGSFETCPSQKPRSWCRTMLLLLLIQPVWTSQVYSICLPRHNQETLKRSTVIPQVSSHGRLDGL